MSKFMILKVLFLIFIYLKGVMTEKQRQIAKTSILMVHSLDAGNSQGWAGPGQRRELGTPFGSDMLVAGARDLSLCLEPLSSASQDLR